ncbi:MAG: metal-sensitive transcriptional regulator [Candidatus Saccharimonadales bacterium]
MIEDIKKRALHRAKIIEGQMRGIQKMIEKDDYCMDVITQSLAVQKSLGSLNKLVLENHLRTHIKDMFTAGDVDRAVEELLVVYELGKVRGKS